MTTLADRTIGSLRRLHDDLAIRVARLSDEELSARSGASDWTVAQVLSHLGSGAEITLAGYRAALEGRDAPGQDFNESVWSRWDTSSPRDQAAGFLKHDAALVAGLEELTPHERETLRLPVGFLPEPLSLATFGGMRLNEAALHGWDVRVALDPGATIDADTAEVLVDHLAGGLGFLLGFAGRADQLPEPTVVRIEGSSTAIAVDGGVSLTTSAGAPTARLTGGVEAAVRLIAGRLTPAHTPADVRVNGNVTLEDLRRVFPGY